MSWLWLGVRDVAVTGVEACAAMRTPDGTPAGFLVVWPGDIAPPYGAGKVDARAVDGNGPPGWVSLVLAPEGISLPFDDPAVSGAIRRVLSIGPAAVCSTLSLADDRFVGALTACGDRNARLEYDPFARLFPARVLFVEAGVLGRSAPLPGPVMQRYGGSNPWPWDRFAAHGTM